MEGKLSKLLTSFRKNHSTQHCLVNMLEKNGKTLLVKVVLFVPCSWTCQRLFDKMDHDLLIAKLGACSFQEDVLVFVKSNFTNRQKHVRVNSNFSTVNILI